MKLKDTITKYLIGVQNFEQDIKENYVYLDKTTVTHQAVTIGKIEEWKVL